MCRLSCRQGTNLQTDMVCEFVPFFMPRSMATGAVLTYEADEQASHYDGQMQNIIESACFQEYSYIVVF